MGGSRRYRHPALARTEGRAPAGSLLTRDFRRLEDEQEENAARERNPPLDLVPAFLFAVHLIFAAAILVGLAALPRARNGTLAAALLALCLLTFSSRRAGAEAAQLRRRLEIGWAAHRASRFIEEFEQAGHGWFWETTGRGALSYVSEHLAA